MFKKTKKTVLIFFIAFVSCNSKLDTASDVVDAYNNATVSGNADWANFIAQKAHLNLKIKIGGKTVNVVDQVVSTQGTDYQKTETFQKGMLTEMVLTNPSTSYMIKFENGQFVGINNFPSQEISLLPLSDFQKLKRAFCLKDTLWSNKPVYHLVSDSIGEEYMFDKETKYLIAFISKNIYGRTETTFSEHKKVKDYVLPFKIVTIVPGSGFESEVNFTKIEVNPSFSANDFEIDPLWKRLEVGQKIPKFELPYARNQDKLFSNRILDGKIVLIDFWATWCKPCLEEFPSIEENYTNYKDKGFEVVSVSLEKDRERLISYLDKNPFPWEYTLYSKGELKSKLASDFQIVALPKQILIDENGKIIAMDGDLREGKLSHVLKNLFDK